MRHIRTLLCLLLILTACTKQGPEPEVIQNRERPLTEAYVASMEDYEIMEILLLGRFDANTLKTAAEWGYDFIDEIDDRIIYAGESSAGQSLAYLLIPRKGMTLTIGSYDPLSNKISEVYFQEDDALPVIYVENVASMTPPAMIALKQDDLTMRMLTGLNDQGHLRTAYLMGIVDDTPYEKLKDIATYGEKLKDLLQNSAPIASEDLRNNDYIATVMNEMIYQGKMYLIYSVEHFGGLPPYLYGIHYDEISGETDYIISYDHESWMDPESIVG